MRLLYITNQICGSGGLERVLSIKANYLADVLQYEVHILTLNQGSKNVFYNFSEKLKYHDITLRGNPIRYIISYRKGIKNLITKIKPDVISVCDDGLKGLLLPLIIGKPCVMIYERHASKHIEIKKDTLSGIDHLKNTIKFKLMNFGGAKFDKFIVLTKANVKEWPLKNIQVIPNPLSFFPQKENQSTLNNKVAIAVGNHGYQKGFDLLLQSWQQVVAKHPNWVLEIYGKLDAEQKHILLAEQLGISDSVKIYPPVKDIASKYQNASIYLLSSRSEGFGMVLIEAMAYGVPCVSFDCPSGPRDIITDGEDGFLIQNGDIKKFAVQTSLVINNNEQRKQMGKNARLKAENYLPKIILAEWDILFKALVQI